MFFVSTIFFFVHYLHSTSSTTTYSCQSNLGCGCSSNTTTTVGKIVGGENAASNTWGWAVSLYINENSLCGGSIISSSWIITAAHCVYGMNASQVAVSAATNELFGLKQWRYASSVVSHPKYDNNTEENDIALIEVSPPFNMTDPGIAKICLPMSTNEDFPPDNSTV